MNRAFIVTYINSSADVSSALGHLAIACRHTKASTKPRITPACAKIADAGTLPRAVRSFLPQDVADYSGPLPYSSLAPPFDDGLTYAKFFADPAQMKKFPASLSRTRPRPSTCKAGLQLGDPASCRCTIYWSRRS